MRVVIAMMKHETNTYSPVPTPIARFAKAQTLPYEGREVYDAFKDTNSGVGAFIDLAEEAGAHMVFPISANAPPSGPVHDDAYKFMTSRILDAVEAGCDAIFLDLHGAMVTQSFEDGEGRLLAKIRKIAPNTPIAVSLDMHTNMYPAIADNATVIGGFQTYPHIDNYETAARTGRPLYDMIDGKCQPTMAWGNRPMLPHVMRQGTDNFPNKNLQEMTKTMEAEGALIATLFVGFPHADIHNAGLSAAVVTDNNQALAEKYRDQLLDFAWKERESFVYQIEPLEKSLARAKAATEGPVIVLDHYDNAASGGTMDTMTVLRGVLATGLEDVAVFAIHDPSAVQEMIAVGIGSQVALKLGGKFDMPSIGCKGEPLPVTGTVKLISNGQFHNLGPAQTGILQDMGPTVVLDTGKVEIVVISRHQEPNDLNCFLSLGIDPLTKKYLMLKSRIHYRAGFGKVAKQVIECAGVGVCTSDYDMLDFKNVRRPIYPLDKINDPNPA